MPVPSKRVLLVAKRRVSRALPPPERIADRIKNPKH